jgi:micrococcal nuclease
MKTKIKLQANKCLSLILELSVLLSVLLSAWLPLVVYAQPQAPFPPQWQALVSRVIDGDTLVLQPIGSQNLYKTRIAGIDAPEICQPFGDIAKDNLARKVQGLMVTVNSDHRDEFGRELGQVYLNGEDLGAYMVKQGWAWSFGRGKALGPYQLEQAYAKNLKLGLFASSQKILKPSDFRRQYQACQEGHQMVKKSKAKSAKQITNEF